jgi:hypothetical protein
MKLTNGFLSFLAVCSLTILGADVTLVWNDPNPADADVAGYRVYQQTNAALPFIYVGSTNVTNFVVKGLAPGKYYWYVTCSNFWGESLQSNQAHTPAAVVGVTNLTVRLN